MSVDLEALTGHTPGPWKVDENGPSVIGEGGAMPICDMRGWGRLTGQGIGGRALAPGVARGIQQSNAALCAAAPDLIAEVRALRAERDALKAQAQRDIEAWWAVGCHCGIQPDGSRTHKVACPLVGVSQLRAELAAAKARLERWNPELQQAKADLARTEAERATLWQHGLDMSRERDLALGALERLSYVGVTLNYYQAVNLREALKLVPCTGDWHCELWWACEEALKAHPDATPNVRAEDQKCGIGQPNCHNPGAALKPPEGTP